MSDIVTHKHGNDKDLAFENETDQINDLSDHSLMEIEAFSSEYILKLTKAALIAGNIPDDAALVPFIGNGLEEKNSQAVENWIHSHIEMLVNIAPQHHIEKIITEIDNRLLDIKTDYLGYK